MPSAKDILESIYWEPGRNHIKKELWHRILRDLPHGMDTGGVCVITWGTPGAEAANAIDTELQITDASGDDWAETSILRFTCTAPGLLSQGVGAKGTVIVGSGTNDMIVETDANGEFSLRVTDSTAALVGAIYIMAGPTQGSPPLDARTVLTNTFA